MRAPRRAGRGDEQVAKLDRAQAGAAAQLQARDLLRGHGESLRVRVRGMPGVPGPRRARNLSGVWPRLGAAARSLEPAPLRARLGGHTDRPALGGALGPARSLVGMCLLSSLQLLPNPTGESRESERAPGSRGRRVRRAREPGAVGPERGGQSRPGGAFAPRARRAGSEDQVQRDPSARDPVAVGEGGVPGDGAAAGT